jgi:hypothetical protein
MIGISVADYIMEIWDYIILVNRSDYALYEQASDNDVLCDLLIGGYPIFIRNTTKQPPEIADAISGGCLYLARGADD